MIRKIPAGQFKAQCLQIMEEIKNKHISLIITKRGVPIAKLVPVEEQSLDLFGVLKGSITVNGDIISPVDEQWEAEK